MPGEDRVRRVDLRAHGLRPARLPFRHGAINALPGGRVLADSYHVSRLNTNTGRLTDAMFRSVVEELLDRMAAQSQAPSVVSAQR